MCTHFLVDRRVAEVYSSKAAACPLMPEAENMARAGYCAFHNSLPTVIVEEITTFHTRTLPYWILILRLL